MSAAVRLLVWPVGERLWCAARRARGCSLALTRLHGRALALTLLRNHRLLHAVPPRPQAQAVTLVSQLRDRVSTWALKQWHEVEKAETGMKSWVKKCVVPWSVLGCPGGTRRLNQRSSLATWPHAAAILQSHQRANAVGERRGGGHARHSLGLANLCRLAPARC
jgi:hypothetical protein